MKSLYIFNNDFRLGNNQLLNLALEESSEITFAAFAPEENWGEWRRKFYIECLYDLDHCLANFGHSLRLINNKEIFGSDLSQFNYIYTPLVNLFDEKNLLIYLESQTKIEARQTDRLLKQIDFEIPHIFTEFRKKIEKTFSPQQSILLQEKLWPKPGESIFSELPSLINLSAHTNSAFPFTGGRTSGKARLKQYLWESELILTYKETRNGLLGLDYSTKFSPWLATGCLCPHEIYREVENFEAKVQSNQSTYWIKFELWWREYFRWVGDYAGNKLFYLSGIKGLNTSPQPNKELFNKWCRGETGQEFLDANMRELNETGWMSNRGRQNVASYLVKDLNLPWLWGAKYFENHLIDYDPWSNYGNWQYVAGVGNDPRENRYFNLERQANIYDPEGEFRSTWKRVNPSD